MLQPTRSRVWQQLLQHRYSVTVDNTMLRKYCMLMVCSDCITVCPCSAHCVAHCVAGEQCVSGVCCAQSQMCGTAGCCPAGQVRQ